VRRARTAKEAAKIGRDRSRPLRSDWETVKVDVMRAAVRRKFETHTSLAELLLSTGDEEIIENLPDPYWGSGGDGSGRNMLGHVLMEVRAELRGRSVSG
jgi:ribA/ribD-fused uncharacterized protein